MANTSKESEKKSADDMAFRNNAVTAINKLVNENAKLKDVILKKKKEGRRESAASRIQGLQTISNTLGKQKIS